MSIRPTFVAVPFPCEAFAIVYLDRATLAPRYLIVDRAFYRIVPTTEKARIPWDEVWAVPLVRTERELEPEPPEPAA